MIILLIDHRANINTDKRISVSECKNNGIGIHNCARGEDAGVQ